MNSHCHVLRRRWFLYVVSFALSGLLCTCNASAQVKNVILMISDGAGFNTWQAASYYEHGQLGDQPYDGFPVHYGCTTYMLHTMGEKQEVLPLGYDALRTWTDPDYCRGQATDSAAAATALYTGYKTTSGRMGTDATGERSWTTVAQLAESLDKRSGVVTSVQVSHATPGAMWSHEPSRNAYAAIFNKMVSGGLDVIMGAGHPLFGNDGTSAKPDYKYAGGEATWRDLTDGDGLNGFTFIDAKEQFENLAAQAVATPGSAPPKKVIGIARCRDTLQYRREGKEMAPHCPLNTGVPSLETMSRGALAVLSQQPEGFLLMIEGGAVDWANHDNNLPRMVEEQVDFNRAVAAVVDWVETHSSWDETLLIITADHECGMLWGSGSYNDTNGNGLRDDDEPLRTFGMIENRGAGHLPAGCYFSGGHTNALVPLWAKGVGSEVLHQLVDGVDPQAGRFWGFSGKYVDNTDVFRVIYAALISSIPAKPDRRTTPAEAAVSQ